MILKNFSVNVFVYLVRLYKCIIKYILIYNNYKVFTMCQTHIISHILLKKPLLDNYYFYIYFVDEEAEVQEG